MAPPLADTSDPAVLHKLRELHPQAEDDYESYAWPPVPPPPPPDSDEGIDCSVEGLLDAFERRLKRGKAADAWGWRNEFVQLLVEVAPSAATDIAKFPRP